MSLLNQRVILKNCNNEKGIVVEVNEDFLKIKTDSLGENFLVDCHRNQVEIDISKESNYTMNVANRLFYNGYVKTNRFNTRIRKLFAMEEAISLKVYYWK